jgi:acetyl esterase/lipase
VCGGAAAFFSLWIIVPAPLYVLWLAGIAGTEWSLWWGLLGLVGISCGVLAYQTGSRVSGKIGVLLGAFAAGISLLPLTACIPIAQQQNTPLSLRRFFFGEAGVRNQATTLPQTVTFATVSNQKLQLDIYPAAGVQTIAPTPALIVVHGGSWRAGNKSDFAPWDRWLATQGYTVFDIEYRIAPQPNWREATGDVKSAIGWVKRHAERYHVDPDRLALLGRSAGGHLALLAAYTPTDKQLPASDSASTDTRVRAVVSLYSPTDLTWGYYHPAKPDVIDGPGTLRRFIGDSPADLPDAFREASPITHVGSETPPTLLFHGERDLLVGPQHTVRLSQKLTAAHIPFQSVYVPYALHGFDFNINGWGSQIEQPILLAFLRRHLAPHKSRI